MQEALCEYVSGDTLLGGCRRGVAVRVAGRPAASYMLLPFAGLA